MVRARRQNGLKAFVWISCWVQLRALIYLRHFKFRDIIYFCYSIEIANRKVKLKLLNYWFGECHKMLCCQNSNYQESINVSMKVHCWTFILTFRYKKIPVAMYTRLLFLAMFFAHVIQTRRWYWSEWIKLLSTFVTASLLAFVQESRFGTNGRSRSKWYHGPTEIRYETALALGFTEWVRKKKGQLARVVSY